MNIAATRYEHIEVSPAGVPTIAGTTMKVAELVAEQMAYGWSPEELHFQHTYLTLGQIHAALAYYWDHKEEVDRDIEQRLARTDQLRQRAATSPLVARLRSKGRL
jgi:uncharacterized protein (DUF433 family)